MELWQQQEHLYVIGRKSHVVCEDSSPRLVSTETVDVGECVLSSVESLSQDISSATSKLSSTPGRLSLRPRCVHGASTEL